MPLTAHHCYNVTRLSSIRGNNIASVLRPVLFLTAVLAIAIHTDLNVTFRQIQMNIIRCIYCLSAPQDEHNSHGADQIPSRLHSLSIHHIPILFSFFI